MKIWLVTGRLDPLVLHAFVAGISSANNQVTLLQNGNQIRGVNLLVFLSDISFDGLLNPLFLSKLLVVLLVVNLPFALKFFTQTHQVYSCLFFLKT